MQKVNLSDDFFSKTKISKGSCNCGSCNCNCGSGSACHNKCSTGDDVSLKEKLKDVYQKAS